MTFLVADSSLGKFVLFLFMLLFGLAYFYARYGRGGPFRTPLGFFIYLLTFAGVTLLLYREFLLTAAWLVLLALVLGARLITKVK